MKLAAKSLISLSFLLFWNFQGVNGQTIMGKNQFFLQANFGFHYPFNPGFEEIYKEYEVFTPFFSAGYGQNGYFLIARYFKTNASVKTETSGVIILEGNLVYDRDTYYAGFRSYTGKNSPLYAEICYIYTVLKEEMKTNSPRIPSLEGTTTVFASGASLGAGLQLPFLFQNLNASFHFNYDFYIRAKSNIPDLEIDKLGGINANMGVIYVFSF